MTLDAAFGYAPGTIILFGEHAVVYGQPALAATMNRGIRVAVSKRDDDVRGPVLKGAGLGLHARPDTPGGPSGEGPEALRRALDKMAEMFGERVRALTFVVDGAIPVGSGLGSSAALSVALLRGVKRFFEEDAHSDEELVKSAYALERVFHGNPSGVDHTVVAKGGLLWFRRGETDAPALVERVLVPRRMRFAVGLAGPHAGTAKAVAALRDRARRHETAYARIYEGIGALAIEARRHVELGAFSAVGELMDLNQGYLNALGVSTPAIEALCAIARERGALGAKLTGAGGGGAVIALVDDDPAPVVRAWSAAGYAAFETELEAMA